MKQYSSDHVPANMFTKAALRKMGLVPISKHSAYVTFPPSIRRYKLYTLENARPADPAAGYSLCIEIDSEEARQSLRDMIKQQFGDD
ncbi:hypothetical protein [Brevibacillus sp. 179-C 1.1 NHS]|uniref:hypothetical protein n=1 Tax=Brevibacillus sp. 179-C 1.1 NHS TaxID=3235177 RepID=UPI00399F8F9E